MITTALSITILRKLLVKTDRYESSGNKYNVRALNFIVARLPILVATFQPVIMMPW